MIGTDTIKGKKYRYWLDRSPSMAAVEISIALTMVTMKIVRLAISPWYFNKITIRIAKQKHALTNDDTYRPMTAV